MQGSNNSSSVFDKSLNWIANHTYRRIPTLINTYQKKSTSPKKLSFQDYILTPSLARQAGLMYVRQLRRDYLKQKQDIQKVISQYKTNTDLLNQKPHELLCPICLQLFSGPVTTSCNHTFCRMCIDESILFNPNCPSCRKNIRAEELIVSKATQAIIRMLLYKLDTEQVQKYVKKELQYQDWLQRRTLRISQVRKGQIIDVRDTQHVWCKGSVVEILPQNVTDPQKYEYLLVHYQGWAARFDEVISLESLRLATCGFYMSRYEIPHYNLDPNNPEHYRCPVVTGPPRLVVPQPAIQDNENIINSSSDIIEIQQREEQLNNSQQSSQLNNSQLQHEFSQNSNTNSQSNNSDNFQYQNEQIDGGVNLIDNDLDSQSDDSQLLQEGFVDFLGVGNVQYQAQQLVVLDNDGINIIQQYVSSQPCQVNQLWEGQLLQLQINQNQIVSGYQNRHQYGNLSNKRLHRDHSLPQVRQLSQLSQTQYGQLINQIGQKSDNQQPQLKGQHQLIVNSQINQQIIDQLNFQQQYHYQQNQSYHQNQLQNQLQDRLFRQENSKSQNLLSQISLSNSQNPQFKLQKIYNRSYPNHQQTETKGLFVHQHLIVQQQ